MGGRSGGMQGGVSRGSEDVWMDEGWMLEMFRLERRLFFILQGAIIPLHLCLMLWFRLM